MTRTFTTLKGLALSFLGAAAIVTTIGQGTAEAAQCGPRAKVIAHITGKIKANRHGLALAGKSNMIELYVAASGKWIITATKPNKATCVIAAGSNWESVPLKFALGPAV